MFDLAVAVRLRRAILCNDALLVKRIVKNNPKFLQNPDYNDKSNTSLHLAAALGFVEVVKVLVSAGHDACEPNILHSGYNSAPGISLNASSSTPLHLAATHGHNGCVEYLCLKFPQSIDRKDKNGATPLMLAAQNSSPSIICPRSTSLVPPQPRPRSSSNPAEDTTSVVTLLMNKASATMTDATGNTALHYASAWGNLKVFRLLITSGAPPLAVNDAGYTAADYASTLQATTYCRSLVSEYEQLKESDEPLPLFWQQQPPSPQSLKQQQKAKLRLNIGENDGHIGNDQQGNSSPISPSDSRAKNEPGKNNGLGLSRAGIGPRAGMRVMIQDDQDESDDEAPLTARKISHDDTLTGSYDWDK